MNNPLLIPFAIFVCVFSFYKPIVGVFVIITTTWLGAIFPVDGAFTLNRILGIICLFGIFTPKLIKKDRSTFWKFSTLEWLFIIYIAILSMNSIYSISNAGIERLMDMVTGFLLYYLIKVTVVSKKHLESLVKTLVVISFVVATYSLIAAQNASFLALRIYGQFQVNVAGIICYVGVVCSLWLFWAKKLPALAVGILSTIFISVIFLSGNRTGFIALLMTALILGLRILLSTRKRIFSISALILFIIVFIASINIVQNYFPYTVERIFSVFSTSDFASLDEKRIDLTRIAWLLFLDHPILGIGFGNFPFYYSFSSLEFSGHLSVAHNLFLTTLAENGFIGFISLISIYIYIIFTGLKALFLRKKVQGIFDLWFPIILFFGVNFVNAFFHSIIIDKLMFTIFALYMIVLRNHQIEVVAVDELEKHASLLPKNIGTGSEVL